MTVGFGFDVSAVQAALNRAGTVPPLIVDGVYGQKTQAAVVAFQQANGLTVDGIVGNQTLHALGLSGSPPSINSSEISSELLAKFPNWTMKFEGYTPYMYTDSKGFVTTGVGNLIDSISAASVLPWKHPDGSLANLDEISSAWQTVKDAYPNVQSVASQSLTDLRLTKSDIESLVQSKMRSNHQVLLSQYPKYPSWPLDAQMALHSIAWAWGAMFARVWGTLGNRFTSAVNSNPPDFKTAASAANQASGHEETINAGIVPRDKANTDLWVSAASAIGMGIGGFMLFSLAAAGGFYVAHRMGYI